MWCSHCRQDVPGIVAAESTASGESTRDAMEGLGLELSEPALLAKGLGATTAVPTEGGSGHFVCARCGQAIGLEASDQGVTSAGSSPRDDNNADSIGSSDAILRFDTWEWELDQQLQDARHLLQSRAVATERSADQPPSTTHLRFDPSHSSEASPHATEMHQSDSHEPSEPVQTSREKSSNPHRRPALLGWTILSVGVMVLVCGGILMGWSMATARAELWSLGLPLALGGQATMLLGLLFLLERMWRDGRRASDDLEQVHSRLDGLRRTALANSNPQAGQKSYYVHAAEGAPPTLLLADLKGQLDHLTEKLSQQ